MIIEPGDDTEAVDPIVTINVSPLEGYSPLTVRFSGNGFSPAGFDIDDARTSWDFDTEDKLRDGISVNATSRSAQYTYVLPPDMLAEKTTETFIARLTMYETAVPAHIGAAQAVITVHRSGSVSPTGGDTTGGVQIVVREQGGADEVTAGTSPFEVELSLQTTGINGVVESVLWDLGDGNLKNSSQVSHTYVNQTESEFSLTITATVTVLTPDQSRVRTTTQQQITVYPGDAASETQDIELEGTQPIRGSGAGGAACGILGIFPTFVMLGSLMWLRRGRS